MTPLVKIALVVGAQLLVLAGILGFKAYTTIDTQTVLLMTRVDEPSTLVSDDGLRVPRVTFDVEYVPRFGAIWDDNAYDTIYVEVASRDGRVWDAVRVSGERDRTRDGSAILRADGDYRYYQPGEMPTEATLKLEIGDIYIPRSAAADVPAGGGHDVAVEVEVDRFGNATPKRFVIDGEPVPLRRP